MSPPLRPNPQPPGPPAIPLLGHLPQYWRDPLQFFVRCAGKYGDVVRLRLGKPTLLLTNPDDIGHVLVTHADRYAKNVRISGTLGQQKLGDSVLTSSGAEHRKQRRAVQPLFHPEAIEAFAEVIREALEMWISARSHGERLDISDHMRGLAQRIMTNALFGRDIAGDDSRLQKAVRVRRRYHEHIVGAVLPMPQYQPARVLFQYRGAIRHIDRVLARALQMRRNSTQPSGDMLSGWLHTRYEDGTAMTDAQIRAEALTFMDTGYETVGVALTWTWYLLTTHPQIETRLASELREVLGGRLPDAGDIPKLAYTASVFKESLRLYPPAWNLGRIVLARDVLPSGVEVLPGMKLFLCQYIVHRNPRYFSEPEVFQPERFDGKADSKSRRFSYFPFGGGAHKCLGLSFAELESILVIAALAQRFRFELEPQQTVKLNTDFALRPRDSLWMKVLKKSAQPALVV
jgi:cytochrome P450